MGGQLSWRGGGGGVSTKLHSTVPPSIPSFPESVMFRIVIRAELCGELNPGVPSDSPEDIFISLI